MIVTFTGEVDERVAAEVASLGAVAELRADMLPYQEDFGYTAEQVSKLADSPLIVTVRSREQGGHWEGTEAARKRRVFDLLDTAGNIIDGVDYEIDAPHLPNVVKKAHSLGVLVIGSVHNFEETPSVNDLEDTFEVGRNAGSDVVKVATAVRTASEYQRAANFTRLIRRRGEPLVTVPIGNPFYRTEMLGLGSMATYASAGEPVAEGQTNFRQTHQTLLGRYSAYAALFAVNH